MARLVTKVIDSWWMIGLFIFAVILNLALFDRNNIGEWYSVRLGAIVIILEIAGFVHSPLIGIIGILSLVILVGAGITTKFRDRRRSGSDDRS